MGMFWAIPNLELKCSALQVLPVDLRIKHFLPKTYHVGMTI